MAKDCTNGGAAGNRTAAPPTGLAHIERHFFVCENARPAGGKPSCGARGAVAITTALQEGLGRHPELWGRIAITPTGCLGPCFEGPTIVVYPEAVWYVGVAVADVPEIVESHMRNGVPVARLLRQTDD
jgi:(2Fe-2S) ferredoxin